MGLADYSPEEITYLLDLAAELKAAKKEGRAEQRLVGKEVALIFEKDSTRTRCAFEVAAYDQGAHVTFIGPGGSHMGHKETAKDTADWAASERGEKRWRVGLTPEREAEVLAKAKEAAGAGTR